MAQFRGDDGSAVSPQEAPRVDRSGPLVARARALPDVSFRAVLSGHQGVRIHWASPGGLEVVGCGECATLAASGANRFETIERQASTLFEDLDYDGPAAARPRAFGGVAFHDHHRPESPWEGFTAGQFVVPSLQVTRTDHATWVTVVTSDAEAVERSLDAAHESLSSYPQLEPTGDPPGIDCTRRTTTRTAWIDDVEHTLDRIDRGDLRKVVLAQAVDVVANQRVDVPALLERLRRTYPQCYRFMLDPGAGATFFGAPPERLVSVAGRRVETEALAGSVGRGQTPEEDDDLAEQLLSSERLQREHGLVVDAIRERLEPRAASVAVGDQTVRSLATIQHLQTPISASLDRAEHVLSVVEALHPTPAVGGLPSEAALDAIERTERFERGWYAAPVGWFDASGDGEFAVGIRSGVATDERVRLFAGNGIVADSDPVEEWEEVLLKFRPILDELATVEDPVHQT